MVNCKIFCRFGPFHQVFGQVKELLMFELHEIKKMLNVAACSVVFSLLCDLGRPAGVLILIKNASLFNIFGRLDTFPEFWGGLRSGFY